MTYRIGIDIGGTFTDFTVFDESSGEIALAHKIPSVPQDPIKGILEGLKYIKESLTDHSVSYVLHGTTIGTNAMLQESEAAPGLITTRGFRDVYELARQWRGHDCYNLFLDKPKMFLPRRNITEVTERVNFQGEVLKPLDLSEAKAAATALAQKQVPSVAICLLFSFANPAHERELARIVQESYPGVYIALSSEVDPQFREYERTCTTVANAYIGPKVSRYLIRMRNEVHQVFPSTPVLFMQSNGGVGTPEMLARIPAQSILSGPVAGVVGAKYTAELAGFENVISIDVGGTSCDMSVIPGQVLTTPEIYLNRHVVRAAAADIHTIGSGGGSIARLAMGVLKVGPESAGADPGPACYGMGGTEPTLTDALVILGWLNPDYLLAGKMHIHKDLSVKAIQEKVAHPLQIGLVEAAAGVVKVLTSQVAAAMRTITIEKGYDPREFVLAAFGGAGPTVGGVLAKELNIPKILVPQDPGNFCAFGMLTTDLVKDLSVTKVGLIESFSPQAIRERLEELEARAVQELMGQKVQKEAISLQRFLELRYSGQSYEVPVPVPAIRGQEDIDKAMEDFHEIHGRTYGHKAEGEPIEIVNFRVRATGAIPKPALKAHPLAGKEVPGEARLGERPVYFEETKGYVTAPVYNRGKLQPGNTITGPCVIEELTSTTVVLPNQAATMDAYRNLLIDVG